ncbi:MAG: HD domain-containing protein [Deltaproteobacteria bacterium]|nr:HD domain-containing protein [Deltaproteobacteria bacterium]
MSRVMFVDDDELLLYSWRRLFQGKYEVATAESGSQALEQLEQDGPCEVVISDFQMPCMDGAAFLEEVGSRYPDSIRIMLTGQALLETAMEAVNKGRVFRFLTKPCPRDLLDRAIRDSLHQHRLVQTEREYFALREWQKGLEGLAEALVRLVEFKDPYTAGHQRRVAQLAAAMARELGLPAEQVAQVELAASIHDLGKMYVPAEFLNKPGRLNPPEFEIIKLHARIGYEILKPIRFGFPIHDIVVQHHERLDGSGYPAGLRDGAISREARIIAVADVIEAISYHRPYRPAKGLEAALEEIHGGRGIRYDPEAAAAVERLFTKKGFFFLAGKQETGAAVAEGSVWSPRLKPMEGLP